MASEILAGGLGEGRVASTAGGGTALTTTAAFIRLPRVTSHIILTPRNFSTAVVAKFHLNPWLTILKSTDSVVTAPTSYSNAAQDLSAASAGVVLSALPTLANGGLVLVGANLPFRGVSVDAQDVNAVVSTLTVTYRKTDDTWASASATDGTKTGGNTTFGQDGTVTWTVPTDWKMEKLANIPFGTCTAANGTGTMTGSPVTLVQGSNTPTVTVAGTFTVTLPTNRTGTVSTGGWTVTNSPVHLAAGANTITVEAGGSGTITIVVNPTSLTFPGDQIPQYWTRWVVSAALTSPTTANSMVAMNRNTSLYNELISGQTFEEKIQHGTSNGVGNIEALVDAGTGSLIVNTFTQRDGQFV